ncbi:hypothetical protein IX317_000130 [Fusobacterium sp. DD29]|uniref:hypothetical protein n=1 Tax=unclassified Fusobacterium TaxID=2648384 RepID=UPI001B8D90BF|nr:MULTISPECIES: hypothetical protein [unclassified Fusobacterium]MBR8700342.1 hypothetical protein [Fusobacterium sp. DD45]MBR8710035.1 hypothetical protein [Fusobacterium sp. DD28]MBR8748471.1 hypothetical protein [Fusobacterium sp. DD29]MBR8750565.1 hypothetical protein [Fusobacterium sp. DD26]MBR8760738.1 hypothetical protein [Fusobacterium sp. DD25]
MTGFDSWEENLYDSTFDTMFDALSEQYKNGEITVEELKRNIEEQQQVLLNAFFEGETKSAYCNAVVDAHQFVLALINKGKLKVENN